MSRFVHLGNHYINVKNILRVSVSQTTCLQTIVNKPWQTEIILQEYLRFKSPFDNASEEARTIGYNNRIIEHFDNEDSAHCYARKIIRGFGGCTLLH